MKSLIVFILKIYQKLISPLLGQRCRYYPSCSEYTLQSFENLSFHIALWYSTKRILKCHPFSSGGYDPPIQKGVQE